MMGKAPRRPRLTEEERARETVHRLRIKQDGAGTAELQFAFDLMLMPPGTEWRCTPCDVRRSLKQPRHECAWCACTGNVLRSTVDKLLVRPGAAYTKYG